jgi:hypothetical protein
MSPTRPRPLRPPVFDVLLAAALTIVLVIGPGPRDAFPMLLAVALVAPLAWRRTSQCKCSRSAPARPCCSGGSAGH